MMRRRGMSGVGETGWSLAGGGSSGVRSFSGGIVLRKRCGEHKRERSIDKETPQLNSSPASPLLSRSPSALLA